MRTGRYTIAELFGHRHIEQLVIPEIQRDYVWKQEQIEHFLNSIIDNFKEWQQEKKEPSLKLVVSNPTTDVRFGDNEIQFLQDEFAAFHAQRTYATNIGFVYAYCDADLPGQYFLIDGQQRLTTLYLVLLAVAARDAGLKERFRARYCLCSAEPHRRVEVPPTKLDYRLREYTAEFLHRCVQFFLDDSKAAGELTEQSWYLSRFSGDTTIQNLVGNYTTIRKVLEPLLSVTPPTILYEYLEDSVECWYFDTNESAQGEELYLYLNARGESTAGHEDLKARLLAKVKDSTTKNNWGRRWEEWQDHFWQNREVGLSETLCNPNADRGFNSFLSCIQNLEALRNKGVDGPELINLEIIDEYIRVLYWLHENKEAFKKLYNYAAWVDHWFSEMWEIFNHPNDTDWAASPSDNSKSTAHNRMVLVWGTLLCVVCALEREKGEWERLDQKRIFRAIRMFYLQYHNFGRAVASLLETASGLLNENPDILRGAIEERVKWDFLKDRPDEEYRELEAVIWEIEDHPFNLDGHDLDSVNLTHLLDLAREVTGPQQLQKIRDAFYELFPVHNTGKEMKVDKVHERQLAAVLLYYGTFWQPDSPWYYENYNLGDWRRTIRGKGSKEAKDGSRTVFRRFFDEFLRAGRRLDEFVKEKEESVPVDPKSEMELRKALIWYSEKLKTSFLEKGMYVAMKPNEEETDAHFTCLPAIWNTKRHFKGVYGNQKMADLIKEETK